MYEATHHALQRNKKNRKERSSTGQEDGMEEGKIARTKNTDVSWSQTCHTPSYYVTHTSKRTSQQQLCTAAAAAASSSRPAAVLYCWSVQTPNCGTQVLFCLCRRVPQLLYYYALVLMSSDAVTLLLLLARASCLIDDCLILDSLVIVVVFDFCCCELLLACVC